jgi:hypothetical protein
LTGRSVDVERILVRAKPPKSATGKDAESSRFLRNNPLILTIRSLLIMDITTNIAE